MMNAEWRQPERRARHFRLHATITTSGCPILNLKSAIQMKLTAPNVQETQRQITVGVGELLGRLQSGERLHVVLADKKIRIHTLPALPGATPRSNLAPSPTSWKKEAAGDRWRKDRVFGFIYVLQGEADLQLSRRIVTCRVGDLAIAMPYTWRNAGTKAHWERPATSGPGSTLLWLMVEPEVTFVHLCWSQAEQHVGSRSLRIADEAVFPLLELLQEELAAPEPGEAVTQVLLLILDRVHRVLREERSLEPQLHVQKPASTPPLENLGERIQQYIDANLVHRPTLEGVAHTFYVSKARITRELQKRTGHSFNAYLQRRRLEHAKHLLETSAISVKSVAWQSGFASPNYFNTVFRRETGMAPLEYRKKCR